MTTASSATHAGRVPATGAQPRRPWRWRAILLALVAVLALGALAPAKGDADEPPVLKVGGETRETLKWSTSGTRNTYRVLRKSPSERSTTTVIGRSFTPPPTPGETVMYRVKAAYNESAWSNPVYITYAGEPGGEEEPPPEEEPAEEAPEVGRPKYRLDAGTYFDPFGVEAYATWVDRHVDVIKGYPPHSDPYVWLFGLPVVGYHDPATEGQAPLGEEGIREYVKDVERDMAHGYAGVHVDDANWTFKPSPGPQSALAKLLETIRAAEPTAEIEINSQYHDIWPQMKAHNPYVERALKVVNVVTKEFGVGPTAGINTAQDYAEFMQYVDALHAKGVHTSMTGDYGPGGNTEAVREYNLATYFLVSDGDDFVNGLNQTPLNWWSGFNVNLGEPTSGRERLSGGLWTRRFSGGVVYTLEPGATRQTVRLGKPMRSALWGTVESVTLKEREGAVLKIVR
jgi:hypothetical protein